MLKLLTICGTGDWWYTPQRYLSAVGNKLGEGLMKP